MISEAQRETKRAYAAAYYQLHKEEFYAQYQLHKEERLANRAAYYEKHRDAILEKNAEELAKFTEWLQILRTNNGCEDCGQHEGRLEHHHVDPTTKRYNISEMSRHSLDALEAELDKCAVLCVPCHNKRHVEMKQIEEEN